MGAETGQYLEPLVRARAAYDQMMLAYRLAPHGPLKDACQEALHALADLVNEAQASAYATGSLSPAVSVGPAHQRPARPQPRPSTAMVVDTEPPPPPARVLPATPLVRGETSASFHCFMALLRGLSEGH
jgi:hypothetical protein